MEKVSHIPEVSKTHIPVEPILTPPMQKSPMKPFPEKKAAMMMPVILFVVVILAGVGTGWMFAKRATAGSAQSSQMAVTTKNSVANNNEAGIDDSEAFPDTAEGVLEEGGISGEGTHHIDRGLGETKYVYISSTVINLQNFVGKKVEVHGQTISGKKAGWLMDVGKIKVIE